MDINNIFNQDYKTEKELIKTLSERDLECAYFEYVSKLPLPEQGWVTIKFSDGQIVTIATKDENFGNKINHGDLGSYIKEGTKPFGDFMKLNDFVSAHDYKREKIWFRCETTDNQFIDICFRVFTYQYDLKSGFGIYWGGQTTSEYGYRGPKTLDITYVADNQAKFKCLSIGRNDNPRAHLRLELKRK